MYDHKTNSKKKQLLSSNSFLFDVLPEKCFSLCVNQMDHTITCQIMTKTFLNLELTTKEMKTSKRVIMSLGRANWNHNHPEIMYQTQEEGLQVTNKWEDDSSQSPQRIQQLASKSIITFLLNIFFLEGNLSKKSCLEKTTSLKGSQLLQMRGRNGNSSLKEDQRHDEDHITVGRATPLWKTHF